MNKNAPIKINTKQPLKKNSLTSIIIMIIIAAISIFAILAICYCIIKHQTRGDNNRQASSTDRVRT